MEKAPPLVEQDYLLEKFRGKGGWTYAQIPEILQDRHTPFGWVRVRGTIDDHEIRDYHLMPMGNGKLFLPVKAAIRKKIKKQAGDYIHVVLFADNLPLEIPEELRLCLSDAPNGLEKFTSCTDAEQRACIKWIYAAKTVETRVRRIAKIIDKISKEQKIDDL